MSEQIFALASKSLWFPPYQNLLSTNQLHTSHRSMKYTLSRNTACLHLPSRQAVLNAGGRTDAEMIHTDSQRVNEVIKKMIPQPNSSWKPQKQCA